MIFIFVKYPNFLLAFKAIAKYTKYKFLIQECIFPNEYL